ncbi:MAG: carbohydrate kinase family protein [Kineosporiaceae bacterium]|nr:carbohydrate kinase family protein [Kineosporiaceae bacterium]
MTLDVLVLGDLNPDLLLTGDVVPRFGQAEQLLTGADLLIGGSGAIAAHGLARLGVSVALIAEVGEDGFGREMLARIAAAGVEVSRVRRRPDRGTGLSVVLSDGPARSTMTYLGTIDADPPDWRHPDDVPAAQWLHVSSVYLQRRLAPELPRLLTLARSAGLRVSMDTNLDPSGRFAGLAELLPLVDLVLPNASEALAMAAALGALTDDPAQAALGLAAHGPVAVVKNGADGALLARPDGSVVTRTGRAIHPVDTTGAGDTFDAAFLAALLAGQDDATALAWGDAAGRLATRALGGTAAQPTRAELLAELADHAARGG